MSISIWNGDIKAATNVREIEKALAVLPKGGGGRIYPAHGTSLIEPADRRACLAARECHPGSDNPLIRLAMTSGKSTLKSKLSNRSRDALSEVSVRHS